MVLLSWHLSVVFYEYKSSQLIIKSDRYDLSYHCNFSMVFKATITIEWNGWGQPSCSMVFGWFLGPPTISQTMRCNGPSSSLNCSISIVLCVGGSKFICLFALILFSVEQKQSAASAKSRVLRDTSYILVKLPIIFWEIF